MELAKIFEGVFGVDREVAKACINPCGPPSELLLAAENVSVDLLGTAEARPAVAAFLCRRLSCEHLDGRDFDANLLGCEFTGRWLVEVDGRTRIVPAAAIFAEGMPNQAQRGFDVMRAGLRFGGEVNKLREDKVFISLNLTPASWSDRAFVNNFLEACCIYRVDPHDVVLEILETDLLVDGSFSPLKILAEAGVGFALDDFNNGIPLQNLRFLTERGVRPHCIKIDGKDTQRIASDRGCWQEMKSLLQVARASGVGVVIFECLPEGLRMEDIAGLRSFMMERENLRWENKLFQGVVSGSNR